MHSVENLHFYPAGDLSKITQIIRQIKTLVYKIFQNISSILLSSMLEIPHNIDLDGNNNSSPNAHFRFLHVVLRNQKLKKEKYQCSQNLDLI